MKRLIIIVALAAAAASAQEPRPKPDETWKCYALADFDHKNVLVTASVMFAKDKPELHELAELGVDAGMLEVAGTEYAAVFTREGFERRWNFGGDDLNQYAFIIEPDGKAGYYDFTREKERVKPSSVYDCVQARK